MSDIVYFKQDGQDVDVTISEVGLNSATLSALESVDLNAATLAALETIELGATTLAALETTTVSISGDVGLDSTTLAALESVDLNAATLAALETISLSTATLAALEKITLQAGGSDVGSSNPLPVGTGPKGGAGGAYTVSNLGDTVTPVVGTGSGQPLNGNAVVEYLGILIKNGSGSSSTVSVYWSDGTSSTNVLAREAMVIANGDNVHLNFPPGTYGTSTAYMAVVSTTSGTGLNLYTHYHVHK